MIDVTMLPRQKRQWLQTKLTQLNSKHERIYPSFDKVSKTCDCLQRGLVPNLVEKNGMHQLTHCRFTYYTKQRQG